MPWMWDAGHMWGTWGLWGWLLMPLMMALVWVPVLLLLAWGARLVFGGGGPTPTRPGPEADARELARRAYARGDVTRERFLEIVADLDQTEGARR